MRFEKWFTYFSGNSSLCLSHLWSPMTLTFSHSLLCSREEEEIPLCSLPAGTDQSRPSACLQISYSDVICLGAWLNTHLLMRLWFCVLLWVCMCECMLTSSVSSQLEWRRPLYLLPYNYRHPQTQNDRWTFTTQTRYLQIQTLFILQNNMWSTWKHTHMRTDKLD